ncbi:tyrosine-type recombinase/integrase [Starkeya sp. ORNL1]|uniref:DUF6538 domain-containing protein n=1 Tax=Starkeya sp. ORNL1 TaxID=2709380 RepID=UPI001462B31D|nr:DUF6538 domain-containing protein [Starkeya sp. ORNL1]QJP17370.1 tyrosine-type recombinase/integrase [Starkeya sp. ORNL1]
MAAVPGLKRRGSAYTYRRRVPDELRPVLEKRELWVALGTTDYRKAVVEARRAAARVDDIFAEARKALAAGVAFEMPGKPGPSEREMTTAVAVELWRDQRAAASTSPVPMDMPAGDWVDALEKTIAMFRASDANARAALFARTVAIIRDHKLSIPVPEPVKGANGLSLAGQSFTLSPDFLRLQELVRRGEIEGRARALDRVEGKHGDMAHDPLFEGVTTFSPPPVQSVQGTTLGEAIERFNNDPTRAHLTESAGMKFVLMFRALKEIVGEARPVISITRPDCAETQELIAGLPPNFGKVKRYAELKTLKEVAALAAERRDRRLSVGTLRVYTHSMSSFFNWCISKGIVTANPAVRMAPPKSASEKGRRPYTIGELTKIFSALPVWSGSEGGRFWVPLIGLFSGMRLGEIVTLRVADVTQKDGVDCMVLRREADRRLKTPGAERVVPIHPELVRLGLLRYAEAMRKKGAEALFPDLPGEDQDQVADIFQKRFAYWTKTTLGVNAPGTSFHSFRHGFRDALREAGSPIDATRALGGWARSGGVEERYGQGTRPKTLAEVMARVKFDVDLSRLKPM